MILHLYVLIIPTEASSVYAGTLDFINMLMQDKECVFFLGQAKPLSALSWPSNLFLRFQANNHLGFKHKISWAIIIELEGPNEIWISK